MGVRHGEISVFFVQHTGVSECLILTMIPACLTDFRDRFAVSWRQSASCLGVSETPNQCSPIWGSFIQNRFRMQQAARLQCVFSKSEKTGHEREKRCTQRCRKCLFLRGKPSRQQNMRLNILKDWNSSSVYCHCKTKILQPIWLSKSVPIEYCVYCICSLLRNLKCVGLLQTVLHTILCSFIRPCVNTCQYLKLQGSEPLLFTSLFSVIFKQM